jgi:hypothetical protein
LNRDSLMGLKNDLEQKLDKLMRKSKSFKLFDYDLKRNRYVKASGVRRDLGHVELPQDFLTDFELEPLQNVLTCWYNRSEISLVNLNKG